MKSTIRIEPPNGFVLVADDLRTADVPYFPSSPVRLAATSSCIAVGCIVQEETEITVGPVGEISPDGEPALDQMLETKRKRLSIWTLHNDKVLEVSVPSTSTRVRIWGNRLREPDKVLIALG